MTRARPVPHLEGAPERVAILGGGMAAMVTAFELTRLPDWGARYEITVYQQGHRLGGKCASAVNTTASNRIEEHGLHLLWGFYENVFRVMTEVYEELGRSPDAPLARWSDAVTGQDVITVPEARDGGWTSWSMACPPNDDRPGDDGLLSDPRRLTSRALAWAASLFREWARGAGDLPRNAAWEALAEDARRAEGGPPSRLLRLAGRARRLAAAGRSQDPDHRRRRVVMDLMWAVLRGIAKDRLAWPRPDWFAVDHLDARAWLARHGASRETLDSPLVAGLYHAGYAGGTPCGAGTLIQGLLRVVFTYKGSVLYRMNAGAGDVLFAPLYEVLRRRGVRFVFFHTVTALEPSPDGRSVARVRLERQAVPVSGRYDPLVDVNGLPCWPAAPRLEQLADPESLAGRDLEDWFARHPSEPVVLEQGRDFDRVVLGLSVGVHPHVAKELQAASPRYDAMVRGLATTGTRSVQLWTTASREALGWTGPAPVVIPFAEPFDTWCDMAHLLPREGHGPEVRGLQYLTAALPDEEPVPDRSDAGYPARQRDRIAADLARWSAEHGPALWPGGAGDGGLRPDLVADVYVSPMKHPSDRYVLAAPGTNALRLRADESGFDNLVLAGDWTLTALSVGCLEAATMSGFQAARVLEPRVRRAIGDWLPDGPRRTRPPGRALPKRVVLDGDPIASPPVQLEITLSMFVLPASKARLQALCDHALRVSPDHRYRAAAPWVVLYCAEVDNYPVVDSLGWVPERDFGFWVPTWRGGAAEPFVPERLVTFTPYLWVDSGVALTGGREVFGFAKQLGRMSLPTPGAPPEWSLSGLVIERHARTARAEERPILSVRQTAPGRPGALGAARDAVEQALGIPDAGVLRSMAAGGLRMVFVKQTPDALDASRACYQALLEAECRLTGGVSGGALPGEYAVTLHRYDSLRIAHTLGLEARAIDADTVVATPLAQGRVSFSARIDAADLLWESRA